MNDTRKPTFDELASRLERLPRDIPVSQDLWPSIEHAISNAPSAAPSQDRFSELATDVEPPEDLWPGIEARIRAESTSAAQRVTSGWRTTSLLAACVALVALGSVFMLAPWPPGDDPSVDSGQLTAGGDPGADFEALFPPDAGSPQTRSVYRDHIVLVRDQREAIEASMEQYPNDASLRTLWRHAYETELALIDEAERVLTTI